MGQGGHWLTYRKIWSNSTSSFSTLQSVLVVGGEGGSNNHGIVDNAAIVHDLLKIFVLHSHLLYIVYCVPVK